MLTDTRHHEKEIRNICVCVCVYEKGREREMRKVEKEREMRKVKRDRKRNK